MRSILLLGLSLAAPLLAAETGYRVVQPDGTVEYSDQAVKGAEEIQIREVNTYPADLHSVPRASSTTTAQETPPSSRESAITYESIVIVSPQDQETVWFDEKGMTVTLAIKPSLGEQDKVVVRLDGVKVASENSTTITLKNINRGSHTLSAAISDAAGKVIREAAPVSFFMRQRSILNPNSPLHKPTTPTP